MLLSEPTLKRSGHQSTLNRNRDRKLGQGFDIEASQVRNQLPEIGFSVFKVGDSVEHSGPRQSLMSIHGPILFRTS